MSCCVHAACLRFSSPRQVPDIDQQPLALIRSSTSDNKDCNGTPEDAASCIPCRCLQHSKVNVGSRAVPLTHPPRLHAFLLQALIRRLLHVPARDERTSVRLSCIRASCPGMGGGREVCICAVTKPVLTEPAVRALQLFTFSSVIIPRRNV